MGERDQRILARIREAGWRGAFVSARHLPELKEELDGRRSMYEDADRNVGRYVDRFDFSPWEAGGPDAAVLVLAVPQPMARAWFTPGGVVRPAVLPPTYLLNTNVYKEDRHPGIVAVTETLRAILADEGAQCAKRDLPLKLLAWRSGLGRYGRNNICYIDSQSSFYWLAAYMTDLPCEEDSWTEARMMDQCGNCRSCAAACPGGAIRDDRFLLHVDRCLTFYNEDTDPFPEWIAPDWHNTAIGCMECQWNCPVDRASLSRVEDIAFFDREETQQILDATPFEELSPATRAKLEEWNFAEDYVLLPRNLAVLFEERTVTCREMKRIEARAAASGISYRQMMENAGTAAADRILARETPCSRTALVLCGKGNNGGDGYVVARRLKESGFEVAVLQVEGEPTTEEAKQNRIFCEALGIPFLAGFPGTDAVTGAAAGTPVEARPFVVDAIYGTGFHGDLPEPVRAIARRIRDDGSTVYALDIPTGVEGDSGAAVPDAVKADVTIAFHRRKPAHDASAAAPWLGEVVVVPIGI